MRPFVLALLAACSSTPDATDDTTSETPIVPADDWAAPGEHGVGVRTVTLVDEQRGTPANGDQAALDTRTLPVEIWYPSDVGTVDTPTRSADPQAGPFPVMVFAHGFMSGKNDHALLGATLASRGWVFVAPTFPLSNLSAPGGATVMDVLNQADDMGFLLDEVIAGEGELAWLTGVVDGEQVAFGGMSLGGTTTMLASLYEPTRDDRVDAIVAVAPATCMLPLDSFAADEPPILFVHGDADAFVPLTGNSLPAWDASDDPKVLVTLKAGTHTGFPDATAALFDAVPNADSIGCSAAGAVLNSMSDGALTALIPEGTTLLSDECAAPCEGTLVTPTMKPVRQGLLLRASVDAFLASVFEGDAEAGVWLSTGLVEAEADVSVQAAGLAPQ